MNHQRLTVAVAAGLSLTGYAAAQESPYQVGTWVDVRSRMELVVPADSTRPGYTLVADHDPDYAGSLRDDYFMITILKTGGPKRSPLELRLMSRDSLLRLALVDVTGDGREELITIHRIARASESRNELLHVWTWNERAFERILDVTIAGMVPSPWRYEPTFADATGDGVLDLELVGTDGGAARTAETPHDVPSGSSRAAYAFNPKERKLQAVTSIAEASESEPLARHEWQVARGGVSLKVDQPRGKSALLIRVNDAPSQIAREIRHDFTISIIDGPQCRSRMDPIWFFSPDDHFKIALADLTGDGIDELITSATAGRSWEPRTERLSVRRWCGDQIGVLLDVQILGELDGGVWRYESSFKDLNGDGTVDLLFVLAEGSMKPPETGLASSAPPRSMAGYAYDPTSAIMKVLPHEVLKSSNFGINPAAGGTAPAECSRRALARRGLCVR